MWGTGSGLTATGTVSTVTNVPVSGVAACGGPGATVTDQAGNVRTQCADGAGRLAAVVDPGGGVTSYTYDAQDNVKTVSQGSQTRTFTYVLGRRTQAVNPESPAVNYNYDGNGNLTCRSDAAHTVTLMYDALNRPTGKCYSTTSCAAQTPPTCTASTPPNVSYTYDTDFAGALSSVSYGVNTTSYTHDNLGRVSASTQTTGAQSYTFSNYSYTLTDQLTSITYPSGRVINYTVNNADQVTAVQAQGAASPYASGITYSTAGDIASMTFGNGVIETRTFNDQFETIGVQAGSNLTLNYYYCNDNGATLSAAGAAVPCATGNTGSPWSQLLTVPGQSNAVQEYRHDALNRMYLAGERTGTAGFNPACPDSNSVWCQQYSFDGMGNRSVVSSTPSAPATPVSFDPATNRITDSGFGYDAAGNLNQMQYQSTSTTATHGV